MSTFDHAGLIQGINEPGYLPQGQPETMRGFSQLAQASDRGAQQQAQRIDCPAIGVTQRCSGCIGFHVKALQKLVPTRTELEEMQPCAFTWAAALH